MNAFLLFIVFHLPYFQSGTSPEDFPSGYHITGEDSLASRKAYVWRGHDTVDVWGGTPATFDARLVFSDGCVKQEREFRPQSKIPERVVDFMCADGKVVSWSSPTHADSGRYFYRDGRIDSVIRFEKIHATNPFTPSRTMKIRYDSQGLPSHRDDYWYEGLDSLDDSLHTDYTWHLPDSVVMFQAAGPDVETRTTVVRLKAGRPVSMTETAVQGIYIHVYDHFWTYGETAALRDAPSLRRTRERSPKARLFESHGILRRPDGRAINARNAP